MNVILPTWFKGRQGKTESAGDNRLKLTGPNLVEAVIGIRAAEPGGWHGFVRKDADGADLDATHTALPDQNEAWSAAFEMFRNRFVA